MKIIQLIIQFFQSLFVNRGPDIPLEKFNNGESERPHYVLEIQNVIVSNTSNFTNERKE